MNSGRSRVMNILFTLDSNYLEPLDVMLMSQFINNLGNRTSFLPAFQDALP